VQLEYLIACVNANEKIIARQLYKNLITDMLRMFTKTKTNFEIPTWNKDGYKNLSG